jgi:hypothetical protein
MGRTTSWNVGISVEVGEKQMKGQCTQQQGNQQNGADDINNTFLKYKKCSETGRQI